MALERIFLVFVREKCQLLCNTHIPLSEACNMNLLEIHENAEWHFFREQRSECITSAAERFNDECHFKVPLV